MPASVKTAATRGAILRSPFLWVGLLLLLALVGALVFSDSVADLARFSAEYQRRIQQTLSGSLRDIKSGSGSLALWTLATVCFGYGVVRERVRTEVGLGNPAAVLARHSEAASLIVLGCRSVVEGERADLDRLMRRLREDPRHTALRILSDAPIAVRRIEHPMDICAEPQRLLERVGLPCLSQVTANDAGVMLDLRRAA